MKKKEINNFFRDKKRNTDEMRKVSLEVDYVKTCAGSALFQIGNTRVLCTASVEERVPRHKRNSGEGWLTSEYAMLPGSGSDRISRDRARGGRSVEIQRLIGRSLRAVVDLKPLDGFTVYVDCDVIQADGGTRCASITGGYIALCRAVDKLLKEKKITDNPLKGLVAAISVGIVDGKCILDLDYSEDVRADVDMNIVMTEKSHFVELQGTAEGDPFRKSDMSRLISLAQKGIGELIDMQSVYFPKK